MSNAVLISTAQQDTGQPIVLLLWSPPGEHGIVDAFFLIICETSTEKMKLKKEHL